MKPIFKTLCPAVALMVWVFMCMFELQESLAAASESPATAGQAVSPVQTGPQAVFPETRYQFDAVMEGTEIKHDFVIENQGHEPLIIKGVKPD